MDPHCQLCHNPDGAARARVGEGNIKVHSHKEGRYRCHVCKRTFSANEGTVF